MVKKRCAAGRKAKDGLAQSSAIASGLTAIGSARATTTQSAQTVATKAAVAGNWYGAPPTSNNGFVAYSNVLTSPTVTTVASIVDSTHSKVTAALSGDSVLAAGVMGANYFSGASGTYVYTAGSEFLYTESGSSKFTLGLLDLGAYGNGFDNLSFTVKNGATSLLSDNFTSLSAAQNFFTDDPFSLGSLNGNVDLTLDYSLTASTAERGGNQLCNRGCAGAIAKLMALAPNRHGRDGPDGTSPAAVIMKARRARQQ